MERYLGIDMHRDSCTAVVLSAGGKKTGQQVVPTEAAALVQYVKSLSGELHVCVEEGEWSEWLVELLSPWVRRLVSCPAVGRQGPRNDAMDARELAERLRTRRTGTPVFKPPREWARLREAVRVEAKLLQDAVRAKQRLKSLYRRRGVACVNDHGTSCGIPIARSEDGAKRSPDRFRTLLVEVPTRNPPNVVAAKYGRVDDHRRSSVTSLHPQPNDVTGRLKAQY